MRNDVKLYYSIKCCCSFLDEKEVLADADENEKWTTDEDDSEVEDEDSEGSLTVRNLHLLNKKAQRLHHQKLENLFTAGTQSCFLFVARSTQRSQDIFKTSFLRYGCLKDVPETACVH